MWSMNKKGNVLTSVQMKMAQTIVYCYVLFLFGLYPLLYRNGYTDILDFKSSGYLLITGITLGLLGVVGVSRKIGNRKNGKRLEGRFKQMPMTDWFVLAFGFFITISWLTSKVRLECFWGTNGRRFGYLALLFCVLSYFVISRYLKYNQFVLLALICCGVVVFAVAAMNFFQFDILGMYPSGWEKGNYISTLGNKNSLASYSSIVLPLGMAFFCVCETKISSYLYGGFCSLGFMAMVASASDSVFCAVIVAFFFLLGFTGASWDFIKKFLILIAIFISSIQLIAGLYYVIMNKEADIGGLPYFFAYNRKLLIVLPIVLVIYLMVRLAEKKGREEKVLKKIKVIVLVTVTLLLFVVILGAIYLNINMSRKEVMSICGKSGKYIYFDETWGNERGRNWIYSINMFRDFTLKEKLFGTGPGTFLFALRDTFRRDVYSPSNQRIIDAHNEFLQFLITTGIMGVILYFGFLTSCIRRFIRNYKDNKFLLAIILSLISFFVQGIINNPHIYTTPIMFAILGIGSGIMQKNKGAQ